MDEVTIYPSLCEEITQSGMQIRIQLSPVTEHYEGNYPIRESDQLESGRGKLCVQEPIYLRPHAFITRNEGKPNEKDPS